MATYLEGIEQYYEEMVNKRRYLHQHPEVSFHEFETTQYIMDFLNGLKHVEIVQPTPTSVLAIFKTGQEGPKIGLRADTDALPIQEERDDIDFQSLNPGVMHACGHDGHTAMLMTACQWFDDHFDLLEGEIYCIFQHAEELPPGGASEIVATGLLDDLDFVYGQHLFTELEVGLIDIQAGAITTNTDEYRLTIMAKGGHSSMPHKAINPISIAAKIIQAFEAIPAQNIGPQDVAVVANTYMESGNSVSLNIIPDWARLGGSVRTFEDQVAQKIEDTMEAIVQGICQYYGATYEFKFIQGCKSVINDVEKTAFVKGLAQEIFPNQIVELEPFMGGEDFEVYSRKIPSTFVWVGAANKDKDMTYGHHHPKFAFDEEALLTGLKLLISVALEYKKRGQ